MVDRLIMALGLGSSGHALTPDSQDIKASSESENNNRHGHSSPPGSNTVSQRAVQPQGCTQSEAYQICPHLTVPHFKGLLLWTNIIS